MVEPYLTIKEYLDRKYYKIWNLLFEVYFRMVITFEMNFIACHFKSY